MSRLALIIRAIIAHPVISLGVVVALVAILLIVNPCSGSSTSESEVGKPQLNSPNTDNPAPRPAPEALPEAPGGTDSDIDPNRVKPVPDPHDYDPEVRGEIERQLSEQPAVQYMPLQSNGVFADLTDILPDGRLLITVEYKTSKQLAQGEWRKFLKKYKDPGSNYVVVYQGR